MRKILLSLIVLLSAINLKAQTPSTKENKFRIALSGGYGYRLAKTADNVPQDFKDYIRKLKSGYQLNADLDYFFSSWGVGASYSVFRASNSVGNVQITDANGNTLVGNLKDDITIQFIGPNAATRYTSANQKHVLIATVALGYIAYEDQSTVIDDMKITGGAFGSSLDIGYDYQIAGNIYIGAKVGLLGGMLKKINVESNSGTVTRELSDNEREGMGRLDLSAGIRFNL